MRCSALLFNRARSSSSLFPSPPTSVYLDILLLPGAVPLQPRSNDSALMRRTKWHSLPGCRSALDARNRLAASELERRWNEKLEEIEGVKQRLSSLDSQHYSLSPEEEIRIRS